jgi:hypothetical protein
MDETPMRKSILALSFAVIPATGLADTSIGSLTELSTDSLRTRSHETALTTVTEIDCPGRAAGAKARVLSQSPYVRGHFARPELPATPAPEAGYSAVLFLHRSVGADAAPDCPISCNVGDHHAHITNAWADAVYAVLMPGYRGRGTVAGSPAAGHDWLKSGQRHLSFAGVLRNRHAQLAGCGTQQPATDAAPRLCLDRDRTGARLNDAKIFHNG